MLRRVEQMSRHQRARTTRVLARWLIDRVKADWSADRIAALWIAHRSTYRTMPDDVECFGEERSALDYAGPWPIVAHPPCGPWGKYKARCKQSKEHGIAAMRFVHLFGGVVEQPLGSSLFREHGRGGVIEVIDQSDYGFEAQKRTLLYWVRPVFGANPADGLALTGDAND